VSVRVLRRRVCSLCSRRTGRPGVRKRERCAPFQCDLAFGSVAQDFLQVVDDSIEFKTRIDNVLRETGFAEARPAKMTIDDLLKYVHRPIQ